MHRNAILLLFFVYSVSSAPTQVLNTFATVVKDVAEGYLNSTKDNTEGYQHPSYLQQQIPIIHQPLQPVKQFPFHQQQFSSQSVVGRPFLQGMIPQDQFGGFQGTKVVQYPVIQGFYNPLGYQHPQPQ